MKKARSPETTIRQEADLLIRPDGTVSVSFLWDDLAGLPAALGGMAPTEPLARRSSSRRAASSLVPHSVREYQNCKLCPKQCGYDRSASDHPACGGASLRLASAGLTLGDEACVSGTRGSGALMLSHCPLRCPHCHNPEMVASGREVSAAGLADIAWRLADEGAHNLQILSPTVHFPALEHLLKHLKAGGYPIPILFKSSGDELPAQVSRFEGLVNVWIPDLKYGPGSEWARRAGRPDYFEVTLAAIEAMRRATKPLAYDSLGLVQSGVLVRHVRAPLPEAELNAIDEALAGLRGVAVSIQENFDLLNGAAR